MIVCWSIIALDYCQSFNYDNNLFKHTGEETIKKT